MGRRKDNNSHGGTGRVLGRNGATLMSRSVLLPPVPYPPLPSLQLISPPTSLSSSAGCSAR